MWVGGCEGEGVHTVHVVCVYKIIHNHILYIKQADQPSRLNRTFLHVYVRNSKHFEILNV